LARKFTSRAEEPPGTFSYQTSSSSDLVAWPLQRREDSRYEFQKKRFDDAEEIAKANMGAKKQNSSINFLGGFIESIS